MQKSFLIHQQHQLNAHQRV